jgi:3-hydroxybutyryl-CoA dehydrogenase
MTRSLTDHWRVAIIGAGTEGAQLARLAVQAGFDTIVEDVFPSRLRGIEGQLSGLDDGPGMGSGAGAGRLEFAATIEQALREADVVLDSVPDELESKLEIFSLVDRMAPPRTILCSPLRAVSIGDLASCTYRSDRCIGVRKEDGAGNWTEASGITLMRGPETSEETAEKISSVWRQLGKQVTVVNE